MSSRASPVPVDPLGPMWFSPSGAKRPVAITAKAPSPRVPRRTVFTVVVVRATEMGTKATSAALGLVYVSFLDWVRTHDASHGDPTLHSRKTPCRRLEDLTRTVCGSTHEAYRSHAFTGPKHAPRFCGPDPFLFHSQKRARTGRLCPMPVPCLSFNGLSRGWGVHSGARCQKWVGGGKPRPSPRPRRPRSIRPSPSPRPRSIRPRLIGIGRSDGGDIGHRGEWSGGRGDSEWPRRPRPRPRRPRPRRRHR